MSQSENGIVNVYETKKMRVSIYETVVVKKFKQHRGYKKRYANEKKALQLLEAVDGIPKVIAYSDSDHALTISRLKGTNRERIPDNSLLKLRKMMDKTIELGVARHSLPPRDILVDEDENVGVVDFERVSIRKYALSPIWLIAKQVSKFRVIKLIYQHNLQVLTDEELRIFRSRQIIQRRFDKYRVIRDKVRNTLWSIIEEK